MLLIMAPGQETAGVKILNAEALLQRKIKETRLISAISATSNPQQPPLLHWPMVVPVQQLRCTASPH